MKPSRVSILALAACLTLAACGKKLGDEAETPAPAAEAAAPAAAPAPAAEPSVPPPPVDKPLEIGSQAAKDDLYCAGIVLAAHPEPIESVVPVESALIMKAENQALALSIAGTGKMIDEGVVLAPQAGGVADAWAREAAKDFAAKKPRIKLETCAARGEALMNAPAPQ